MRVLPNIVFFSMVSLSVWFDWEMYVNYGIHFQKCFSQFVDKSALYIVNLILCEDQPMASSLQ